MTKPVLIEKLAEIASLKVQLLMMISYLAEVVPKYI